MYMSINRQELTPQKIKEANDLAISESGDECKDMLRFDINNCEQYIEEIKDDGTIVVVADSEFGYVTFDIKLTDDNMTELINLLVKRLNKFRAIVDGLKK